MTKQLLDGINSPEDLKKLELDSLDDLAAEIRQRIIETVSHTGGHLASNLGSVELTIALNYVFDFMRDRIIWDREAGVSFPVEPMLGTLGVAPARERRTNSWAGEWGGNFDIQEIGPGATVHLGVNVPGALLIR